MKAMALFRKYFSKHIHSDGECKIVPDLHLKIGVQNMAYPNYPVNKEEM